MAETTLLEPRLAADRDRLAAAIGAVDSLNSWVRSQSYRRAYHTGGPKRAIYELKRQALAAAHWLKWCSHRRVGVIALCRCDGTGKYTPWWEGATPRTCRCCSGRGRVILYFVETEIRKADWWHHLTTWHTPADRFPSDLYTPGSNGWWDAGGWPTDTRWQPNQPGQDLTVSQAAAALNAAEAYFTHRPGPRTVLADYATFRVDDFGYGLHVGETDPALCSLCGGAAREGSYGVGRGRVCWSDHACAACEALHGTKVFESFPLPAALLADAAVREWIERHPVKEKEEACHG